MLRAIGLFAAVFITCLNSHARELPLEAFASLPDVQDVSLSPNGQYLASSIRIDVNDIKGRAVSIVNLETGKQQLPLMAKNEVYFILWLRWASDTHLLVAAMYPDVRHGDLGWGRFESRETTLFSVNVNTEEVQEVLSGRFLRRFKRKPWSRSSVIDFLPDDKEHILMSVRGNDFDPSIYKVNLFNQNTQIVQRPKDDVYYWMTDAQARVRLAITSKEAQYKVMVRGVSNDDWKTMWEFEAFSGNQVWPMGFGKDPNTLYVRAYYADKYAVFKVNLNDPNLEKELIFADPDYDVSGSLIYSNVNDEVIGISYARHGGYTFWDEKYKNFQKSIDHALPNTKNYVYSFSEKENKYAVLASSGIDSGTYYVGDRNAGTLNIAAYRYKNLTPELMNPKQKFNYKARDGLEIEAYLTLPKNKPEKPLPTLIFPHGGPISETTDGFSYWTQFFAHRGYAVLQMNFRGSSGRGHTFMKAGLKNWGKEMQDDVQDGALRLIEKGVADPERICIVGASYGGYAALMGAVKTPEFFRCAASFAGVTDVNMLARRFRGIHDKQNVVDLQIGDDYGELKEVSPLHRAEEIQVPILLVHGAQDRQVKPDQSRKMHKALEQSGKEVTYIELESANHYLTNNDDRVATLRAFEEFLAEHLEPES